MHQEKLIEIRIATQADDVAVGALLVRSFIDMYARKLPDVKVSERRKAELLDVAGRRAIAHVWVAVVRDEIVGTVALWPPGVPGNEAWIESAACLRMLAVDDRVRGQGVSAALCEAAEDWARRNEINVVCLHIRRGAAGLGRFYESRGYVREASGDMDLQPEVFLEAYRLNVT